MDFNELKKHTDVVGKYYGSENLSIHLYSWAKLIKPDLCVELGTGLGSASLWIGASLMENDKGILHTVDDGTHWDGMQDYLKYCGYEYKTYDEYLRDVITKFNLNDRIKNHSMSVQNFIDDVLPKFKEKIDILFSDYRHGPIVIIGLLAKFLPQMAEESLIFIDSAPTYYPSYSMLKDLIDKLNSGKDIKLLSSWTNDVDALRKKINTSRFDLINIYEDGQEDQNSTAVIRISSNDVFPPHDFDIRGL